MKIMTFRKLIIGSKTHTTTCGKTETVSTQTTPHLSLSHGLKCTKYTISTISSRVELHRVVRCSKLQNQTTYKK